MASHLEVAGAFEVLTKPLVRLHESLFVQPTLMVLTFWIDFLARYGLDSPAGHQLVRSGLNPLLTYITSQLYDQRELMRKFQNITVPAKIVLAGGLTFFNQRIFTVPIKQIITSTAVIYCDVMYGQQTREDLNMFFFIGTENNGQLVGRDLLMGNENDTSNCFFPRALCHGVKRINIMPQKLSIPRHKISNSILLDNLYSIFSWNNDDVESKPETDREKLARLKSALPFVAVRNTAIDELRKCAETDAQRRRLRIAMSCCLFSAMTYRTDEELEIGQKEGLLPDVEIYSLETGDSGTGLIAFVSKQYKWATFSFRGTQFEVFRQLLTSIDFTTEYFECNDDGSRGSIVPPAAACQEHTQCELRLEKSQAKVRSVYMREVKRSSELIKVKKPFEGKIMTPMQLARHLVSQDFRLYVTGHSLGGGLAQLFAARLMVMKVQFEAVVTFGATPAGNQAFANWFNATVPCSWRFVYGDEFAPMVPPIPFTSRTEEFDLVHVNNLIHFDRPHSMEARTSVEIEALLTKYATETGLINTLIDHNPFNIMRKLKEYNLDDESFLELNVNEHIGRTKTIYVEETKPQTKGPQSSMFGLM